VERTALRPGWFGKSVLSLLIVALAYALVAFPKTVGAQRRGSKPVEQQAAKLELYTSKMDGKQRPYAVCVAGQSDGPIPLLVVVGPGVSEEIPQDGKLGGRMRIVEQFADVANQHDLPSVVMRATGRGPGSRCQNYGEVDVLEAIEDCLAKYPIDRDRISIHGHSMGGAAVYYLVSRYPDMFSCAVPTAGYADYRLWEKPGGSTFYMPEWEEPSWQARSAAFLPENFEHTPMWIMHGEWDRAIHGNVPVEHSRRMYRLLSDMGLDVKYTEVPEQGHGFIYSDELRHQFIPWMLEHKKKRNPDRVRFATYWLRHNKSYWVQIDQLTRYGERALIDAALDREKGQLHVEVENINVFTVGPVERLETVRVSIGDQVFSNLDLREPKTFHRDSEGLWRCEAKDLSGQKRHSSSGPISDLFFDDVYLVWGSQGGKEDSFHLKNVCGYFHGRFFLFNGGLHRGGIAGETGIHLKNGPDTEMTEEQIKNNNLILFGTYRTNAVLKRFEGRLPLEFGERSIRIYDRTYEGDQVAAFAIFPHPDNPDRYVAVHAGVTPDAVVWGSYLNALLLPDFIVYNGGETLDWGFTDSQWRIQE